MSKSDLILHYIYDPYCGWCYAAAPLIAAARQVLPIRLHGGGMWAADKRTRVTPVLRDHVIRHDRRIAKLTGQVFGAAYFDGLLHDVDVVFDSETPIAAIQAAEALSRRGLDMLSAVQRGHYVEGRRIADRRVLVELAQHLGFGAEVFDQMLDRQLGKGSFRHLAESRELLRRVGQGGFPTTVLEQSGTYWVVEIGGYIGSTAEWIAALRKIREIPGWPQLP